MLYHGLQKNQPLPSEAGHAAVGRERAGRDAHRRPVSAAREHEAQIDSGKVSLPLKRRDAARDQGPRRAAGDADKHPVRTPD